MTIEVMNNNNIGAKPYLTRFPCYLDEIVGVYDLFAITCRMYANAGKSFVWNDSASYGFKRFNVATICTNAESGTVLVVVFDSHLTPSGRMRQPTFARAHHREMAERTAVPDWPNLLAAAGFEPRPVPVADLTAE